MCVPVFPTCSLPLFLCVCLCLLWKLQSAGLEYTKLNTLKLHPHISYNVPAMLIFFFFLMCQPLQKHYFSCFLSVSCLYFNKTTYCTEYAAIVLFIMFYNRLNTSPRWCHSCQFKTEEWTFHKAWWLLSHHIQLVFFTLTGPYLSAYGHSLSFKYKSALFVLLLYFFLLASLTTPF